MRLDKENKCEVCFYCKCKSSENRAWCSQGKWNLAEYIVGKPLPKRIRACKHFYSMDGCCELVSNYKVYCEAIDALIREEK